MLDDEVFDQFARAIHDRYLAAHPPTTESDLTALHPWDELATVHRQQNIAQARSFVEHLRTVGYEVVGADEATEPDSLSEEVIEQMAINEHDRWMDLKISQGYTYGPVRSDDPADRRHPDLLHWDDLDEPTRDKDRDPMRAIPELLATVGLALRRTT